MKTAFSRSRSQKALSKPRMLHPMRLGDWGSDVLSMSASARLSWKRHAFSAIIKRSAPDYKTSSTTNADAVHCEKNEGGRQHSTTFPGEYSRVGLKFEGGEPSEGMVEAGSAVLWGHRVADADRGAGRTATGGGAFLRVGETSPTALSAPIDWGSMGARGSEPVLLDERSESSARRQAETRVTLTEGCGVTTGSTGSVGIACSTGAVEVRMGCSWARKDEGEPADTPDEFKNGSRTDGT